MNRQERIKSLQEEIWRLEMEEVKESQKAILPFLQENCVLQLAWPFYRAVVLCKDREIEKQLISLMEGDNKGSHHFGASISEVAEIRYDDGEISIYFNFSGPVDIFSKTVEEIIKLKLKVSFSKTKKDMVSTIKEYEQDLETIQKFEEKLGDLIVP